MNPIGASNVAPGGKTPLSKPFGDALDPLLARVVAPRRTKQHTPNVHPDGARYQREAVTTREHEVVCGEFYSTARSALMTPVESGAAKALIASEDNIIASSRVHAILWRRCFKALHLAPETHGATHGSNQKQSRCSEN